MLASGNGEDNATVDATLLMCERIAEGDLRPRGAELPRRREGEGARRG